MSVSGSTLASAENDGIALPPLQEFAERAQHVVLLDRLSDLGALGGDHERHRVHAEAGDAELDPEAHDLEDLRLHQRVGCVEVGLEIVEAVEVPGTRLLVAGPGGFLHAGKHHALAGVGGLLRRTRHTSRGMASPGSLPRLPEPGVLIGGVVDDEIDDARACRAAWQPWVNSTKSPSVP